MAKTNQAIEDLLRYNAAILPRKRSSFDKSHSHTTTIDSAWLVPIMWDRVLPGDEKKIRYSGLARMTTPIHPTMDSADLDVWAFFVPDRLWWTHAKEFYGENKDASFNPDGTYVMPYLKPSQYLCRSSGTNLTNGIGSLNDYFGFPFMETTSYDSTMDSMPEMRATAGLHRSYHLIWNDWFRNSSVQPAEQLNDGDTVTTSEWNVIRQIKRVNKRPDYFTSLLREPQAGDDVLLPLGEWAPVVTRNVNNSGSPDNADLQWENSNTGATTISGYGALFIGNDGSSATSTNYSSAGSGSPVAPRNLWADLTNATSATINNIRAAVTVQHLLEVDAMAGKRYQQILQAHFGVFTPDATLQRPELLGASRTPIGMRQVLQTSSTDATSPQGNTAAFSLTNVANEWICNKAFTEPGFILVLAAVRPVHSYSQGLDPLLTKINRYDHYWPVFDNLGNQPVPNSAIYVGTFMGQTQLTDTFGYQSAWTEYRIKQNRVSGLMRPDVQGTLSSWNYSTFLTGFPTLDDAFIREDENLIDRTIAVPSEPQFLLDSYFEYTDIKNMSVHSVPGLTRL